VLFRKEGYSSLFLNASRVKLISGFQTPLQVTTSCRHDHDRLIPFSSVVVTEGHEQLIPFIRTDLRDTKIRRSIKRPDGLSLDGIDNLGNVVAWG
jgi:hypothetical protein